MWTTVVIVIAAVCASSFPILYMFSPWHTSRVGRAFMLQSIAFAAALDLTVLFQFWTPTDPLVQFWIAAPSFTFIAATSVYLTWNLWVLNHKGKEGVVGFFSIMSIAWNLLVLDHRNKRKKEVKENDESLPRFD